MEAGMQKNRRLALILNLLMVFILACTCGPLTQLVSTPAASSPPGPGQLDPGSPTRVAPSSPGIPGLGSASVEKLVRQIQEPGASLVQSFEAVQEVLARGGIATKDVNGIYVAAYAPASPMPETHPDILALTLEARNRAWRLTVNDLAGMLNALGWPPS